jgi:lysophospholipase L1-like esterase
MPNTNYYSKLETDYLIQEAKKQFSSVYGDAKPLQPTDPAPTTAGWYKPTTSSPSPGTNYPNAGNLKSIEGFETLFFFDGTVWTKTEEKFPEASQNITKFLNLEFPVPAGTQTIYDDKYWYVLPGQTATVTDLPSDTSTIWKRIGDAVLDFTTITSNIRPDTYTTNSYFINANAFSGFGFDYGIVNNFNQATFKIGQIVGTSSPFTEVNIRICENSQTGTELARVNKTISIAEGNFQDVTFDFPLIANTTNQNIWIEYWVNGKTGLFKGSINTNVNYRYKTTTMVNNAATGFNIQSTASSAPNVRAYMVLNRTTRTPLIKTSLTTNILSLTDTRPIQSARVAEEFDKYNKLIVDGFSADTTVIKGTTAVNVQTSTFKGWGQLFAGLTNFNRVGYIFRAFDNTLIPTQVRCVIRKTSNTGDVIFDQTKPATLQFNVNQKIYFDLPAIYDNVANDELFISFFADGMIALFGGLATSDFDALHTVKYSTAVLSNTANANVTNPRYQLYTEILKGQITKQLGQPEVDRILVQAGGFESPDLILTSRVWLYPGFQYNIYNPNVCVTKYGDNVTNYRLNYDGTVGKQTNRGFRLDNVGASLNTNITVDLAKGRNSIVTKSQNLLSTTAANGTGITRNVLVIGDSLVNNNNITAPLKSVFDADPMDVTFIGTLGSTGTKHEGRGGWRIVDYYGQGRLLYQINVTGLAVAPGINARYTQGANIYNVDEVNISGGTGYFSVSIIAGSAPAVSGTLTKSTGTGDTTITYASSTATPGNPFYFATTGKFDLGYYLTSTSQSLTDNDWIFFQLGVNDMFSSTDLVDSNSRVATMLTQLNEIIANIHAYNANIRIGLVVTTPNANQDAFGESYTVGQLSEMYRKTGLVTWQKKMIEAFDNTATINSKTYLISAHLNLDIDNNFPTITRAVNSRNTTTETIQSNGVHPASSGYAQIADMYAGIIKYFG